MSNYTLTIQQIINGGIEIFDFNYPFFNEELRKEFEELFINNFLVEEVAHETIALFKHRLKVKLNLIMPYYNKIYESQKLEQRILDNYDVTEEIKRIVNTESMRKLNSSNNSNLEGKNYYKDAPKTRVDINNFDVVTNLSKNIGKEETNNNVNESGEGSNIENYTRTMKGNVGVQTDSDAIVKYWQSLRKVTQEIFDNELSSLFMGVF